MALLPPPDISAAYVDDSNRPSKDFFNWIKSLYQIVIGNVAALAVINAAWTAWTPTITADTGTITTKSAVARFKQVGKLVFVCADITVTTAGTGAGALNITLPVAERTPPPTGVMFGVSETTGPAFGFVGSGALAILNLDGSTPIVSGNLLSISGFYEAA